LLRPGCGAGVKQLSSGCWEDGNREPDAHDERAHVPAVGPVTGRGRVSARCPHLAARDRGTPCPDQRGEPARCTARGPANRCRCAIAQENLAHAVLERSVSRPLDQSRAASHGSGRSAWLQPKAPRMSRRRLRGRGPSSRAALCGPSTCPPCCSAEQTTGQYVSGASELSSMKAQ
jgi:hypothetical protein